jgi:hypothetical protein
MSDLETVRQVVSLRKRVEVAGLVEQAASPLLASVAGVNLNTTNKTTLYTVPAGRGCVVTHVVIRAASASLTTANYGCGFNANGDDVITAATHAELTGATLYTVLYAKAGAALGAAAGVFGLKCGIAQGSAATATVDVYGRLI